MKNLKNIVTILALAVFMLSSVNVFAQNKMYPWFPIHIKFGTNIVQNGNVIPCVYSGICSIDIGLKATNPNNADPNQSYIGYDNNGNRILILSKKDFEKVSLNKNYLLLPNEVIIDFSKIDEKLGKKNNSKYSFLLEQKKYTISKTKKGNYQSILDN